MKLFSNSYANKRVLVTGHTGFKGSWLALWLTELGAEVSGISLPSNEVTSHWSLLKLNLDDHRLDIREVETLRQALAKIQPEIVFHLAAQSLVRRSYLDPLETWSTNLMGTANLLEVCRKIPSIRSIVVITSDKCYENREWQWGYRESDSLGGYDPYSASKAGAELVASSYRNAYLKKETAKLLATARAGNVIGGGDWSEDRLIPDLIRALENNQSLEIRSPLATRPWQHVLESLSGYLMLGQKLQTGNMEFAEAWNFGPPLEDNRTVSEVLIKMGQKCESMRWHTTDQPQPHESNLLYLDSSKARNKLGWQPVWNIDTTLQKTTEWYRAWLVNQEVISRQQLGAYIDAAVHAKNEWAEL